MKETNHKKSTTSSFVCPWLWSLKVWTFYKRKSFTKL